ncbi:MAG TPA: STAS domain-containing protein [Phycisphaerae bacterium]|nr:STAS domain-containing protein [Phycisphaerae bacterium]HPS52849.1 STAS domain-containing protein [Phycisphaerae bacterium]
MSGVIKQTDWQDKTVLVVVGGDIDMHTSAELQKGFQEILKNKPERIIVNLTAVPYMDSSGVASLVKLLSTSRKSKIDLRLFGLSKRVKAVFDITRLTTVFNICNTQEEAMG